MYTDYPVILQSREQAKMVVNATELHSRGTRFEEKKKHNVKRMTEEKSRRMKIKVMGESEVNRKNRT
jgi:hypothetical protein